MSRFTIRSLSGVTCLGLAMGVSAEQHSPAAAHPATVAVRSFAEVALSGDGKLVAWVGGSDGGIYIVARSGATSRVRRLGVGALGVAGTEHDLAWSPDGARLAFLASSNGSGQLALYVLMLSTGAVERLTTLTGFLSTPRWSPEGKRIAFLFTENASRAAGPLQPMSRDTGVIGQHFDTQRIAVVALDTRRVRQVSAPGLYVHEYDWSPDGTRFVATAAPGSGDSGWYVAELYRIDATSGETVSFLKPGMQIASPRWSPDGSRVAYIGGLMSDEGIPAGDVYVVPASGGSPRNLTPDMKASPNWLAWPASRGRILFTSYDNGGSGIGAIDPGTGTITRLWRGDETIGSDVNLTIGSVALARDGETTALIRQSFDQPPEVWSGAIGSWTQVTHANRGVASGLGASHNLSWTSDAFTPQGWLVAPHGFQPSQRYPMVVVVHGGPAFATSPHWLGPDDLERRLAESGYFVFMPNPRGSHGGGEAFERANVKDFGYGDLRDILRGVDAVVQDFPVDSGRVGLTGWSYGGYMTMFAVTQTQRFRAAVAGAGIANWQSYWAQNGINDWMPPYFGATVYDDPGVYARSAPITFIKQVRTPTLVIVGERDIECPAAQSYEFWRGVEATGTKTALVVYADEGHGFSKPAHIRDRLARTVAWFDERLKSRTARVSPPSSDR